MAGYEKQTWVDKISDVTAERMNHIEKGIEDAGKTGGVETGSVIGWTGEEIPEGYEEVDSSLLPANDGVPTGTIVEWEEDEIPEGYEEVEKDIINSTSITDKENKTYSASVIDGNFLNKGKIIIHRNLSCKFSSNVATVDISPSGFTDNNYIGFVAFPYNNIYDAKLVADTTTQAKIQCSSISDGSYYVNIFIIKV